MLGNKEEISKIKLKLNEGPPPLIPDVPINKETLKKIKILNP